MPLEAFVEAEKSTMKGKMSFAKATKDPPYLQLEVPVELKEGEIPHHFRKFQEVSKKKCVEDATSEDEWQSYLHNPKEKHGPRLSDEGLQEQKTVVAQKHMDSSKASSEAKVLSQDDITAGDSNLPGKTREALQPDHAIPISNTYRRD